MVTDMHLDIEDTVDDDVIHDASLHVPYSVVLVALGAFLALITAIMLLFLTGIGSFFKINWPLLIVCS